MTLKITLKPPQRRTKQTTTGWHSLDRDELILWAFMWLERKDNSRFSEPARQWALRLHTTRTTLSRWIENLEHVNAIVADPKNGSSGDDGWKTKALYTVTEPPASVLRFAQASWNVEAEQGKLPASGPKVDHDETLANSGDARGPKVDHITTNNEQYQCKPVSMSVVKKESLSMDSVGGPKVGHCEVRMNSGDARVPKMDHEPEDDVALPKRQLADAENKLRRLLREYGPSEAITKVQQDRVADLTAKITAMQGRSASDSNQKGGARA
jgi:hypothetical protein